MRRDEFFRFFFPRRLFFFILFGPDLDLKFSRKKTKNRGVELGKVLAARVRTEMNACRTQSRKPAGFNYATTKLLNRYLEGKAQLIYPEPVDVFPCDLIASDSCRPPTSYL